MSQRYIEGAVSEGETHMALLSLVKYFDGNTVATLKVLLSMALKGELRGVFVVYRTPDGSDEVLATGIYRKHPEYCSSAAMRLMAQDQARTGPP